MKSIFLAALIPFMLIQDSYGCHPCFPCSRHHRNCPVKPVKPNVPDIDITGLSKANQELLRKGLSFTVYRDQKQPKGEWRWRLQAANNRIIADSGEGYTNKKDCYEAIQLIVKGAVTANIKERE